MKQTTLLLASFLTISLTAQAQQPLQNQLLQCSSLENQTKRLTCYDNLAASLSTAAASSQPVQTMPPVVATSTAKTVNPPVVSVQTVKPTIAPEATVEVKPVKTTSSTQPVATTSAENIARNFGKRQRDEVDQIKKLNVTVRKAKKNPHGKLVIYLENGQVWKQTDNTRYKYKEYKGQPYVERGVLGSFFFSQSEITTRIRVKRIK